MADARRDTYTFRPIGIIHTSFEKQEGMPVQGALAPETDGWIEVFQEYAAGLKDVEGFSHLIILYIFHRSQGYHLLAKPFHEETQRGLFAIRSPRRPNPIGMTVVRLRRRKENRLEISGVDMINGTPLLDIKPYIPAIDAHPEAIKGWTSGKITMDGSNILSNKKYRV